MSDRVADLRSALVTYLRSIDDLVDELGGNEANIVEYVDAPSNEFAFAVKNLPTPGLLVAYWGRGLGGQFPGLRSDRFILMLKPGGSPTAVLELLENGIPTASGADGRRMLDQRLHEDYHPMEFVTMDRRSLDLGVGSIDYWEIQTSFKQIRVG